MSEYTREQKCVAWIVQDTTYDWTEVVFAPTRHEAFYKSEGYQNEGNYIEMRGRRNPEWDQYVDQGYVPKEVLIKDGWWFECCGRSCYRHVTEDDQFVVVNEKVFCSDKCSESRLLAVMGE